MMHRSVGLKEAWTARSHCWKVFACWCLLSCLGVGSLVVNGEVRLMMVLWTTAPGLGALFRAIFWRFSLQLVMLRYSVAHCPMASRDI